MISPEEMQLWGYPVKKLPTLDRMLKAWMDQGRYSARWPGFSAEFETYYFTDVLVEWPTEGQALDINAGASPFSTLVQETHGITAWRQDPLYVPELNDMPYTMPSEIDDIPFPDESMDVITCHSFYTICEDTDAMNEIERLLTYGGQAIIAPFLIGDHDFPPTMRFWRTYTRELFEERLAPILSDCCSVEFIDCKIKTAHKMWILRIIK